jgi:hypothetical protein
VSVAPVKAVARVVEAATYRATVWVLWPLNWLLARLLARRVRPGSVVHISMMVHVPAYMVRILRNHGIAADYLAVGDSPWWNQADLRFRPTRWPLFSVLNEMWCVWGTVSRYEIIHSHFMVSVTRSGWEWPLLARMGRKFVVHYRGCEIRDRERNMALHPEVNICQECDYRPYVCQSPFNVARRPLAARYGSAFLVTTPDLLDFVPQAEHIPFFITRPDPPARRPRPAGAPFKIVHATNHPGIEGSRQIRAAIATLTAKGLAIDFVELNGVPHARVLEELADADVSIGKMKMGYYANLQVESLAAGVPAITSIRHEFQTDAIRRSGLVLTTLGGLAETLEHLIVNRRALAERQAVARASVLELHDTATLARRYADLYRRVARGQPSDTLAG